MTIFRRAPVGGDLSDVAAKATTSVREAQSARRKGTHLLALGLIPLCIVALLFKASALALTFGVIPLAIALRVLALRHALFPPEPTRHAPPAHLPRVSLLLPLRGEGRVVAELAMSLRALDYPSDRIEVIALLEEDDFQTRAAVRICAPTSWRIVSIPRGRPMNKPRASNVGLALATGDIVVVFDAEDRPEPDQARKAVAALAADPRLAVVQARLTCDHADAGKPYLCQFWGLEYAVLFGSVQPALARLGVPFLLGGTSNWFRTRTLRSVGGWDAHNVTEDADLGVRLARAGWRSSVIDSTTWEEAPISLRQWINQRSRWLKGFIVTTAVHFRSPLRLGRDLGVAGTLAITAQLPATLVCTLAHPFGLWLILSGRLDGATGAITVAGYGVSMLLHIAAAWRCDAPRWLALAIPVYWLLQTAALTLALVDLARDPTSWRKTEHGLANRPEIKSSHPFPIAFRSGGRRAAGRVAGPSTPLLPRTAATPPAESGPG